MRYLVHDPLKVQAADCGHCNAELCPLHCGTRDCLLCVHAAMYGSRHSRMDCHHDAAACACCPTHPQSKRTWAERKGRDVACDVVVHGLAPWMVMRGLTFGADGYLLVNECDEHEYEVKASLKGADVTAAKALAAVCKVTGKTEAETKEDAAKAAEEAIAAEGVIPV